MVAFVGVAMVFAIAASRPAIEASPAAVSQAISTLSETPPLQHSGDMVWGKVPYCSCFINSSTANVDLATANVARALNEAHLTVSLKDVNPHDG